MLAIFSGISCDYSTVFQSRLGPVKWIEPEFKKHIESLSNNVNINNLLVCCPSFVSDCLETLEEINFQMRSLWKSTNLFGDFNVLPCLNSNKYWVKSLSFYIKDLYEKNKKQF